MNLIKVNKIIKSNLIIRIHKKNMTNRNIKNNLTY